MVGSSSSSPWRCPTLFLLREILKVLEFYFNVKNGKMVKRELSFPVDVHVAKNRDTGLELAKINVAQII